MNFTKSMNQLQLRLVGKMAVLKFIKVIFGIFSYNLNTIVNNEGNAFYIMTVLMMFLSVIL